MFVHSHTKHADGNHVAAPDYYAYEDDNAISEMI